MEYQRVMKYRRIYHNAQPIKIVRTIGRFAICSCTKFKSVYLLLSLEFCLWLCLSGAQWVKIKQLQKCEVKCDNFNIWLRIWIQQHLNRAVFRIIQNLDHAELWSCRIWIVQNLDRAECWWRRIWIVQNLNVQYLDCTEFGSCRTWIVQNLDHAIFRLFKIWVVQNMDCADRVEFGSSIFGLHTFFYFHFLRPNLHCGLCFLSGNADLFGLQHISEWTEEGLYVSRDTRVHKITLLHASFWMS